MQRSIKELKEFFHLNISQLAEHFNLSAKEMLSLIENEQLHTAKTKAIKEALNNIANLLEHSTIKRRDYLLTTKTKTRETLIELIQKEKDYLTEAEEIIKLLEILESTHQKSHIASSTTKKVDLLPEYGLNFINNPQWSSKINKDYYISPKGEIFHAPTNLNLKIGKTNVVFWVILYKLKKVACNLVISNEMFLGDYKLAYEIALKTHYKFFYPAIDVDEETVEKAKLFIIEEIISLLKSGILPKEKYFHNHFSKKIFSQYYVLDDYRVLKVPKNLNRNRSNNTWRIQIKFNNNSINMVEIDRSDFIESLKVALDRFNKMYHRNEELTIYQF